MKVTQKRYQSRGPKGICWSEWFDHKGDSKEPWQDKRGGLRNEYRIIEK